MVVSQLAHQFSAVSKLCWETHECAMDVQFDFDLQHTDYIIYRKILEVNLFAFKYRLFHEDFSPIYGTHTTCDSRINLNYPV